MDLQSIIVALIAAAAGGGISASGGLLWNRHRASVEQRELTLHERSSDADIYASDLAGLRLIMAEQREELRRQKEELADLQTQINRLEKELDETRESRNNLLSERNEARDLVRGLWSTVAASGVVNPFQDHEPRWLRVV